MKESTSRLYYSIGEVSEMLDIKSHTLHYWESVFSGLKPHKNQAGNRCYKPEHISLLKTINKLLNEEGYSIEGARKKLEQAKKSEGQLTLEFSKPNNSDEIIKEICSELEEIIRDLSHAPRT